MKNLISILIVALLFACVKQENSVKPNIVISTTGTTFNDTSKNSTVLTVTSTISGSNNDTVYKDTVVHLHLPTKEKLVGKWVETSNSFANWIIDTLEFTTDSRFFIIHKIHSEDTDGNYNDIFMNTVYKTISLDTIILIRRPYGFRKTTGFARKLWLKNDTLFGNEMDNYATADIRLYRYTKLK